MRTLCKKKKMPVGFDEIPYGVNRLSHMYSPFFAEIEGEVEAKSYATHPVPFSVGSIKEGKSVT
jgi:hypothetical protein